MGVVHGLHAPPDLAAGAPDEEREAKGETEVALIAPNCVPESFCS